MKIDKVAIDEEVSGCCARTTYRWHVQSLWLLLVGRRGHDTQDLATAIQS